MMRIGHNSTSLLNIVILIEMELGVGCLMEAVQPSRCELRPPCDLLHRVLTTEERTDIPRNRENGKLQKFDI